MCLVLLSTVSLDDIFGPIRHIRDIKLNMALDHVELCRMLGLDFLELDPQ